MRLTALALQAIFLIGVTATVGYPEFRQPARAITIWRAAGPLTPRPDLVAGDARLAYGVVNASLPLGGGADAQDGGAGYRRRSGDGSLPWRMMPISGLALTALNQPVAFANVAVRNIRTGRIEARLRADQNGRFDFGSFAPGSYVVELLGADGFVIAASEMLGAGARPGSAIIRLSSNVTPRALFGVARLSTAGNLFFASTAGEPLGAAADAGMQQTTLPDEEASPRN